MDTQGGGGAMESHTKCYQNLDSAYTPAILEIIDEINRDAHGPPKIAKPAPKDFMKENVKMLKQMQIKNKEDRSSKFPPLRPPNRFSHIKSKLHEPTTYSCVCKCICHCTKLEASNFKLPFNIYGTAVQSGDNLSAGSKELKQSASCKTKKSQLCLSSSTLPKASHSSCSTKLEAFDIKLPSNLSNTAVHSIDNLSPISNGSKHSITSKVTESHQCMPSYSANKISRALHTNSEKDHQGQCANRKMRCYSCSQHNRIKSFKPVTAHPLGYKPPYIAEEKRKREEMIQLKKEEEKRASIPPGHVLLSDEDRLQTLDLLIKNHEDLITALHKLPICIDTLRICRYKEELEKKLAKVEEGIAIFSRPKVFVQTDQ